MSEPKTQQEIMDEFKRNSIPRLSIGQPANWNDLTTDLKIMVIKKMAVPVRLAFRQTGKSEQHLVDSEGLRAMYVHFDDQRINLVTDSAQQLMIRFKNEQNKFLPFLVYLFKVLIMNQLYVAPPSRWFFEKVCSHLPGGRESLKVNWYQETYQEQTLKDKMSAGVRRLTRNILFNSIGNTEPAQFDPVFQLIDSWMIEPLLTPPVECLVFDRNPKPMWELLDIDFEDKKPTRFYSPDLHNYEVGRIRLFMNPKHHIYVYKKHGSHWTYIKIIEGSQHEKDVSKEDSWSNFTGLTEKLEIKTHEQVRDEYLAKDPERSEFYISHCERLKMEIPEWR